MFKRFVKTSTSFGDLANNLKTEGVISEKTAKNDLLNSEFETKMIAQIHRFGDLETLVAFRKVAPIFRKAAQSKMAVDEFEKTLTLEEVDAVKYWMEVSGKMNARFFESPQKKIK